MHVTPHARLWKYGRNSAMQKQTRRGSKSTCRRTPPAPRESKTSKMRCRMPKHFTTTMAVGTWGRFGANTVACVECKTTSVYRSYCTIHIIPNCTLHKSLQARNIFNNKSTDKHNEQANVCTCIIPKPSRPFLIFLNTQFLFITSSAWCWWSLSLSELLSDTRTFLVLFIGCTTVWFCTFLWSASVRFHGYLIPHRLTWWWYVRYHITHWGFSFHTFEPRSCRTDQHIIFAVPLCNFGKNGTVHFVHYNWY